MTATAILATPRLRLRPAAADDIDTLHAIWRQPGVRRYLWDGKDVTREMAADMAASLRQSFIERGFGLWLAFAGDSDAAPVGFGYMTEFGDPAELEIGYGLAEEYWGRGYATEIARALLDYGWRRLARTRIYARTDRPNTASIEVMQRAGMRFERQTTEGAFGGLVVYVATAA